MSLNNEPESYYHSVLKKLSKGPLENKDRIMDDLKKDFPILSLADMAPIGIFVFDLKHGSYPYISNSIEPVVGYTPEYFRQHGIKIILEKTHPDDLPVTTNQLSRLMWEKVKTLRSDQLTQYRFSFNYRWLRNDGKYIHLLQQSTPACVDEEGNPLVVVSTVADISFLKKDNSIVLHVSKYNKKTNVFKETEVLLNTANNPLSLREAQVLRALADQKTNEEIAAALDISVHTVRAHRRNILDCTQCSKMASAIVLAQREGWI